MSKLKTCYEFYSSQWNEWLEHKGNEYLTEQELYALKVFKNNQFRIKISEGMMFYNKPELIEHIVLKLEKSKKEFISWLIERWQFWLLRSGNETDLSFYVNLPIDKLNLSSQAKQSLLQFDKSTLGEIFDTYNDKDFEQDHYFKIILDFMTSCKTTPNLESTFEINQKTPDQDKKYFRNFDK